MSELENENIPLPNKEEGAQKDIETKEELETVDEAKSLFAAARQRLFNVNGWDKICGKASAVFQLTDEQGAEVEGAPKVGYHFKIDIPAPGTKAGHGYDWVRIEEVEENTDEEADKEFVLIRVRPSSNPLTPEEDVAHFFSEKATSNFIVHREKNTVTAAVLGRNEVPNTGSTDSFLDKARNALVGTGAVAGGSYPQWKSLVNGLLGKG